MANPRLNGLFLRTLNRAVSWAPAGLDGDYVVVDGARDRRVHHAVIDSRVESACLYDGELSPRMAQVAPRIVRLEQGSRFANAFYELGWNRAWGVVLRSKASLMNVRKHLRTLAYARTEDGKKLIFRYYDARVLRVFLPTCDAHQLSQMFGPIDAFVLDASDGDVPRVFSRDDAGQLQTLEVA